MPTMSEFEEQASSTSNVAGALVAADSYDPEQAAQALQQARETGLPPSLMGGAPDPEIARRQRLSERRQTLETSPKLTAWLERQAREKPYLVSIVQDDLNPLAELDSAISTAKQIAKVPNVARYRLAEAGFGTAAVVPGVASDIGAEGALPLAASGITGALLRKAFKDDTAAYLEAGNENPFAATEQFFLDLARGQRLAAEQAEGNRAAMGAIERGFYGGLESFAMMTPGIAATIATRNPTYALAYGGTIAGGQAYAQAREEGVSPTMSAAFALAQGGTEALFERMPLIGVINDLKAGDSLAKMFIKNLIREVPTEQATTLVQDFNEWAIINPEKTLGEFASERPERALETLVATAVATGGNTALMKAIDMAAGVDQEARSAQELGVLLGEIQRLAAATATLQRDTETFEGFLQSVSDDETMPEFLYLDGKTLLDSGLAQQLIEMSPTVAEQAALIQTGTMIRIPTAEVMGRFNQEMISLLPDLRRDPNGMTQREAQSYVAENEPRLKSLVERVLSSGVETDEQLQARDYIRQTLSDELVSQAGVQKNVADQYATLVSAFYSTMAKRRGMDARTLFDEQRLRVFGEGIQERTDVASQGQMRELTRVRQDGVDAVVEGGSLTLIHGSTSADLALDNVQIVREGQKQGKRGRKYGGFYVSPVSDLEAAEGYARMGEGTPTIYNVNIREGTKVLQKEGDITRLSEDYIRQLINEGYGLVVGTDPRGRTEYVVIDKNAIESLQTRPTQNAFEELAQYAQTPAFTQWFGASKVVDETGAPIVLYHGTSKDKDFAAFNIGKRGAWFTTDPKEASAYASDNDSQNFIFRNGEYVATNTAARVIPAYVKIENPYTMTEQDRQRLNVENYAKAQAAFFDELRARGHDGVKVDGTTWVVLGSPTQIKSTMNRGTYDATKANMLYQAAYHGTRQRGIEQFDTSFVGTGEGAQIYGWGLYFASRREIAEYYRETLLARGGARLVNANGDEMAVPQGLTPESLAFIYLQGENGNYEQTRENLKALQEDEAGYADQNILSLFSNSLRAENQYQQAIEILNSWESSGFTLRAIEGKGQVYKVEIPEDSEMLYWDKPIGEQPPAVRDAFIAANGQEEFDRIKDSEGGGAKWYKSLSEEYGDRAASGFLSRLGIKGIKYLDGGILTAGDRTHNYVVFSGDDVAITDEFYQTATVRRGEETLEKYGLERGRRWKTREVAAALEARQREKYGTIDPKDRSEKSADNIANWMTEEVMFAMLNPNKSGVGWYSEKFQRALDTMGDVFPELKEDKVSRDLMTALIAITSDGQKVVPNFTQAMDIYSRFRSGGETEGKFTTSRGHQRQESIDNNLAVLQRLYDSMGAEGMRDYLMQEKPISELKQIAKANGGTLKSDYQAHIKMPMSAMEFGPKLGAFYANLMGAHGYLTMDRWWSRTFNRYRGTLLAQPTNAGYQRFKELMVVNMPEYANMPPDMISNDEVLAAVVQPRNSYAAKNFKNGTEFEQAANTIYKAAFENLEDAPFNATDRTFMLNAVTKAQALLSQQGYDLSVADIQAILWYYEKRLYGELGARQTADISYEEAAKRVAAGYAGGQGRQLVPDDTGAAQQDGGAVAEGVLAQDAFFQEEFLPPQRLDGRVENRPAINFEVAPDPDNQALAAEWNALTPQQQAEISVRVLERFLPGILQRLNASGEVLPQTGSFEDSTTASFALRLDQGDPGVVTRFLGFILNQKEMATFGAYPFDGGEEVGAVTVEIGDKTTEEIDAIYQRLRQITVDGEKPVGGQSTSGGVMTILNFSGVDTERLKALVNEALDDKFLVRDATVFAMFPGKGDYDYAGGTETDPRGDEGANRQWARGVRAEATDVLRQELDAAKRGVAERRGDGERGARGQGQGLTQQGVSRIDLNFRDVIRRTPELQAAAERVRAGEMTAAEYEALVNRYKPVEAYADVPQPASADDMQRALTSDKTERIGVPSATLQEGHPVGLRLDIPAYANHGVWVVSVHEQQAGYNAGKSIGYESVASATNVTFGVVERAAMNIATGKPKATIAVMKGGWKPTTPEQAKAAADAALLDPDWVQVGMDPERHSYFYDRSTMEPVVSADEVIQVGPLVLAKNPRYGNKQDFVFQRERVVRGSFSPSQLTIRLTNARDLSTFLHESGHFFLHMLVDLASQPGAPQDLIDDATKALEWMDVKPQAGKTLFETWLGMSVQQQTFGHEKFARAFEVYLSEGKAPSAELESVFRSFKRWLLEVYKDLIAYARGQNTSFNRAHVARGEKTGVLNDEIRAVFDRMLASTEEIQNAEAMRSMGMMFSSEADAAKFGIDWRAYQSVAQAATEEAVDDMNARSVRQMKWLSNARSRMLRKLQKEASETRNRVRDVVTEEIAAEPLYRAWAFLTNPTDDPETGGRFSLEELRDFERTRDQGTTGTEAQRDRTFVIARLREEGMVAAEGEDGWRPEAVAEIFGFTSADELITKILNSPSPEQAIAARTDERMIRDHSDLNTPEGRNAMVDAALAGELRTRMVEIELNALERASKTKEPTVAQVARRFAQNMIGGMRVRDIRPGQFMGSASRAARESIAAMKGGNMRQAALQKRNQLVNQYAGRYAQEALDDIQAGVRYLRKFERDGVRKNVAIEQLDQIDKLLERFEFRRVTNRELDKRQSLADWIEDQRANGIEPDVPEYLLNEISRVNYRSLTVDEFMGLVDSVKQIEHIGRLKKKLLVSKDKREFAEIVSAINASILQNAGNRRRENRQTTSAQAQALEKLRTFAAAHRKLSSLVYQLDGFKDNGPLWNALVRTANERGDFEATRLAETIEKLAQLMSGLQRESRFSKGTWFPSINMSLRWEERIGVALNWGNEGNRQRLLDGRNWDLAKIQPVLDSLSKQDWDFVQAIWDMFESMRPEIGAKERRLFGKEPEWVQAAPVITQFGTYRGGYFPAVYDTRENLQSQKFEEAEYAKRQLQGARAAATTRRNFVKARAEEVKGRPILLTMDAVWRGLTDVIHDLAWHEWLIDANRLMNNESVDGAIRDTWGAEIVTQIRSAINDIAAGEATKPHAMDPLLRHMRTGASVAGLGFNLMNALIQPLGFSQSIVRVGAKWVAQGVVALATDPVALSRQILEKSEMMRNRARTMNRELNDIRNRVRGKGNVRIAVDQAVFMPMTVMQSMVDLPTWWGAYQKALADMPNSMDADEAEATAIAVADQAVLASQTGGQVKDLAAIQRGPEALKLFTTFYGYFSGTYNLAVERTRATNFKSPAQVARLASDYLLLLCLPAVMTELIYSFFEGDDGEDEEGLAQRLASAQVSYLFGMMVGVREMSGAVQMALGLETKGGAWYGGPAGLRLVQETFRLGQQINQGELDRALIRSGVNVAGIALHLPSGQINRTVDGLIAIAEGRAETPLVLFGGAPPQ